MQKGDFCWTQIDANCYQLGKITDKEIPSNNDELVKLFKKEADEELQKKIGLWRHCNWKEIAFDDVPGNVITRLRGTLCQSVSTNEKAFYEYCNYLYDGTPPSEKLNFWDLIHYDDLEDLVGLFLQKECDYFVFPSTNKHGTKDYEYKLIQKDTKRDAVIQCKHSKNIPFKELEIYKKDTFLLTKKEIDWNECKGTPSNKKQWKIKNGTKEELTIGVQYIYKYEDVKFTVFEFDPKELHKWACKKENKKILPGRIQKFIEISYEEV